MTATQTAHVATRSISVEAVPELPPLSSARDGHALALGSRQAEMLERMLLKAVLQGWQSVLGRWV